jgi:hypothetical protein
MLLLHSQNCVKTDSRACLFGNFRRYFSHLLSSTKIRIKLLISKFIHSDLVIPGKDIYVFSVDDLIKYYERSFDGGLM